MSLVLEVNLWQKKTKRVHKFTSQQLSSAIKKTDSFIEPCQLVEIFCFAEKKNTQFSEGMFEWAPGAHKDHLKSAG